MSALPPDLEDRTFQTRISQRNIEQHELVVCIDVTHIIEPSAIRERIQVHIDYDFDPTDTPTPLPSFQNIVRYFYSQERGCFRPAMLTTPLRAEKEIATYSRPYLEQQFTDFTMISLPFTLFIDTFGLFRNMYRSLMGFYLIPQFLSKERRNKRKSPIPLTLGPFGSKLSDVVECLAHITELDEGLELQINGQPVFVCSFVAAIIGDMPSQQLLAGCLGPMANMPCRYCLKSLPERPDLTFNTVELGRYVAKSDKEVAKIKAMGTKKAQEEALKDLGLHNDWCLMNALGLSNHYHT